MLLAIDIGNTNITLGLWDGRIWKHCWRLATVPDKTADEYGITLRALLREHHLEGSVTQAVMGSVVPTLTTTLATTCDHYLGVTAVDIGVHLDLGIRVLTDSPAAVGADRLANAVAAYTLYPGPSVTIDMGTATKLDVVTGDGALIGGVIAPGLRLASQALAERAARLSHVTLTAPPEVIGRNTIHAMQSGLIFGYVSLVEGLVARLCQAHPDTSQPARVIGTGGLIDLIAPHTGVIDHLDPWLTLSGLRLICERLNGILGGAKG